MEQWPWFSFFACTGKEGGLRWLGLRSAVWASFASVLLLASPTFASDFAFVEGEDEVGQDEAFAPLEGAEQAEEDLQEAWGNFLGENLSATQETVRQQLALPARRRGRSYDPLPKMDHHACKSDGICLRPLGKHSLRVAFREQKNELMVEAIYAGDAKASTDAMDQMDQWCLRLKDLGFGLLFFNDNGKCPGDWLTSNAYPHFTPVDVMLDQMRLRGHPRTRRRELLPQLKAKLDETSPIVGKEAALRVVQAFVAGIPSHQDLVATHDSAFSDFLRSGRHDMTLEWKDGQFRPKKR